MPQSGIFDPFASLARNKRETRFSYHRGDIIYCFILTDNISDKTIINVLTNLVNDGYLERRGAGRATYYIRNN